VPSSLFRRRRTGTAGDIGFQPPIFPSHIKRRCVFAKGLDSTLHPYLAGEVLDLDGPIGGYNFQAAFSTGWLAGGNA
jgi:hypothetical protein